MQETRPKHLTDDEAKSLGQLRQEFFAIEEGKEAEAHAKMDRRLGKLNRKRGETFIRRVKVGRNQPCPCGSGRKFKKCCISKMR